jgi:hypothetical protein
MYNEMLFSLKKEDDLVILNTKMNLKDIKGYKLDKENNE